ncbi:MarR family winged helix-turn-helix transcriptional regulator [Labedella endophytica]|uniref:MarR family transcriptional regulator n=1 Tax=Labedella endophytica TaxID=1523160 RepID=A0A433JSB2_9MICO|nr:MarR family transcriptional regulator [Labedella endophytica]RUR01193.1 MarR family transcriptional regulator [Labedella endophytica]
MNASPDDPVGSPESHIDWDAEGIETELGWSLQAMYQGFARSASGAVASVPGGPRGYQVLVAITTEPVSSQLALATRLGIDKTAMTYVIDALESDGLVERRPDPQDRRIRQVHPTHKGRALLTTSRQSLRDVEELLMRDLDADERRQLRFLLARVALGAGDMDAASATIDTSLEQPIAAPERSRRRGTTSPDHNRTSEQQ